MSSAKKAAISLFITVLIFAIFSIAAFVHLFGTLETKFYQPAVISGMENHLKDVSACLDEYTVAQAKEFSFFINLPCVKSVYLVNESQEDIEAREKYSSHLLLKNAGLQGIRIINEGNILFSTFENDAKVYSELAELPFENIKANDELINKSKAKIIFDNTKERIIYSIPFYDSYDLYRGSALFYVAGTDFTKYLISKNILSVSEKAKLVATVFSNSSQQSKGFVLGLPSASSDAIIGKIVDLWKDNSFETQKVLHSEDYNWFVVSDNSGKTGVISLVFKDDILVFSTQLKILLLVCTFITLYLIILFFFNIKQDDEAIIRDKIKKFKIALINEYLLDSDDTVWEEVSKFVAVRKHEVNRDIKKYLGKKAKKHNVLVDDLLEKTWHDVEQVIIYHEKIKDEEAELDSFNNVEEIKNDTETLEELEIIDDSNFEKRNASISDDDFEFALPDFAELDNEVNELDDEFNKIDEELDELEEVEEVTEIEEIEELSEVDELDEAEQLEEVSEVEEVEELAEVDELDEAEQVEEVSEVEETEESAEFDVVPESYELDDFTESEEIDEIEEITELDDFTESEEIEMVEELSEELLETDNLEELNETEQVEEITELEEIEDIEQEIITVEKISSVEQESLENEIPEAELEELNYVEIFSLTSGFNAKIFTSEKIEELYPVDEENPIIETESGIFVISNDIDTKKLSLDQNFQNLVDSVLQNTI